MYCKASNPSSTPTPQFLLVFYDLTGPVGSLISLTTHLIKIFTLQLNNAPGRRYGMNVR
jgi:hypothetical protein